MGDIWRRISSSTGAHKRKVFPISSSDLTSSGTTIVSSALNGRLKTLQSNGRYQCVLYQGSSLQGDNYVYSLFRDTSKEETLHYHDLMSKALVPFLTLPASILHEEHLNAVCCNIWENPTWSAAHIAVLSNFLEAFQSEDVSSHINSLDSENGQTPLHLAVRAGNVQAVKSLLEVGANPFIPDGSGNTPVHDLVSSEKEVKEHHEILVNLTRSRHETYPVFNDTEETVTPLALALQVGKIDLARIMVANNFLLDVGDSMGRPIHYAMKMDDLLLLGEILSSDKSQGFARCSKYGGTSLHWVKSEEALMLLLKSDVEMNARSKTGDTALHVMVKRQRMDCCLQLLIAGADADICDNEGNSPLHTAAMLNNVDMVRALIAFNADVNGCNSQGQSPRHLASLHGEKGSATLQALHLVGAKRCKNQAADCRHGCLPWGRYNGDVWEQPYDVQDECNEVYAPAIKQTIEQLLAIWEENNKNNNNVKPAKKDRLLCLDGGGSRGIVEIQLLLAIERASDRKIRDSFDWIAGTSAGAINALLISHGYTMDECRRIFFRFTQDLFKGTKPYSGEKLERFAKELFGETKLIETEKPKILIASCLSNRTPPALHFFRSYTPPPTSSSRIECYSGEYEKPPRPANDDTKWRALRSSTAAPTFFPPEDLFMDGGLIANNPTCDAMTEISEYYLHQRMKGEVPNKLGLVVSLGTGNGPVDGVNDISVYVPNGVTDIYKAAQTMKAAANLGTIFVNLITDGRFRPTDRVRAWCDDIGAAFFRLSPTLGEAGAIDDTDPGRIIKMMWETQVYIYENMETIEKIGELINKL